MKSQRARKQETKIVKMKVSVLIFNADLYPRKSGLNQTNVRQIMDAMQAGIAMPPVIADEKTLVVVDGNHRVDAVRRLHGPDAEIEVELRRYPSEAAMFQDAAKLNASHGMKLTSYDKAHCWIVAQRLGINLNSIAIALNTTAGRLSKLMEHKTALAMGAVVPISKPAASRPAEKQRSKPESQDATAETAVADDEQPVSEESRSEASADPKAVKSEDTAVPAGMHQVPLKHSVRHLSGQTVTPNQIKGIEEDVGSSQLYRVNQVIHLFERDLVDSGSAKLVMALIRLRDLLNKCEWLSDDKNTGAARVG